ncbi:hypothetical protein AA101099_1803 [Neoasaia chiangmaiensis NBRC 101099]|nr:hypothetical protein AA101099_1803 [Neoasaia chiangmaiensis NBRC 101099]GEN14726.1 hypothetical protein NCH01_11570 [Neoasaia chiangmaiensis]
MEGFWDSGECFWVIISAIVIFTIGLLAGMRISDATWKAAIGAVTPSGPSVLAAGNTGLGGRPRR